MKTGFLDLLRAPPGGAFGVPLPRADGGTGGIDTRVREGASAAIATAALGTPMPRPAALAPATTHVDFDWDAPLPSPFDTPAEWEAPVFDFAAERKASVPSPAPTTAAESAADPAAACTPEPLPTLEWDAPVASRGVTREPTAARPVPAAREAGLTKTAKSAAAVAADPMRSRIRDRYIAVRFPGLPSGVHAQDPSTFVKVARLYFEDDDAERSIELLQYATDVLPAEEKLWLARLEILFLRRQADAFVTVARQFHERFPHSGAWGEVARLGYRFAPREMLFAAGRPSDQPMDAHYGAWPESPNWIEAPWDLTGEVLAVELRGRILGTAGAASRRLQ